MHQPDLMRAAKLIDGVVNYLVTIPGAIASTVGHVIHRLSQ